MPQNKINTSLRTNILQLKSVCEGSHHQTHFPWFSPFCPLGPCHSSADITWQSWAIHPEPHRLLCPTRFVIQFDWVMFWAPGLELRVSCGKWGAGNREGGGQMRGKRPQLLLEEDIYCSHMVWLCFTSLLKDISMLGQTQTNRCRRWIFILMPKCDMSTGWRHDAVFGLRRRMKIIIMQRWNKNKAKIIKKQ